VSNNFGAVTSAVAALKVSVPSPAEVHSATMEQGVFSATFTNTPGTSFTALGTTNLALPVTEWEVVGSVTEVAPGSFRFTDPHATNSAQRYYLIRSP
jgi:hypothetical protein